MFFLVAVAVAQGPGYFPLDGCCSSVEATFTELTEFSGTYTKGIRNLLDENVDSYSHEKSKAQIISGPYNEDNFQVEGYIENVTLGQTSSLHFLNPDGPSDTFESKCVSEIGEVIVERGIEGYEFVQEGIRVTCLNGSCGNGCERVNFEAAGELEFLSGNYTKLCSNSWHYYKDDGQGYFQFSASKFIFYNVYRKECDTEPQRTYPEEMVSHLSVFDPESDFKFNAETGTANECIANNTFVGAYRGRYRAGTAKFVCKGEVEEEEEDTEPWIIAVAVIIPVAVIAVGCYIKGRGKKAQLEALL